MSARPRWRVADAAVRAAVEAWLAAPEATRWTPIASHPRRRVIRLELPDGTVCAVKRYPTGGGRRRLRERVKAWMGRASADREWRALVALDAARVPVPRPRARATLAGGDPLLVTDWREGRPWAEAFAAAPPSAREALLADLAEAVAALHAAGFRHGDLHHGNLLAGTEGVVLLDLQRAARRRGEADRLADLARLEHSLACTGVSSADRAAIRERLDVVGSLDPALRRFLRDHLRGRGRRRLRAGRRFAPVVVGRRRGLREVDLEPAVLERCLAAVDGESTPTDRRRGRTHVVEVRTGDRTVVVKRNDPRSWRRALADGLRGSPAARAFRIGQRLALLAPLAARPLAALEERRFGLPRRSWLLLERVGDSGLDRFVPDDPDSARRCAEALGVWLAEAHAWGVEHRDAKAGNLRLAARDGGTRFWWVDLEDLRLVRTPSDRRRIRALAQLNASLDDADFPMPARRAGFDAYCERLPFVQERDEALRAIVQESLARAHRWRGEGCGVARSEDGEGPTLRPSGPRATGSSSTSRAHGR